MAEKQKRKAVTLIRELCANYHGGDCILLDDGETVQCPQILSNSLICKYFRDAVLPADRLLHAEIMGGDGVKGCAICGKPFRAVSPRAKYCERCSKIQRSKRQREYMRNKRG